VGGIKEKVLAAKRAGIKKVILPERNKKDVDEIDKKALKGISFTYVKRMEDVLEYTLQKRAKRKPEAFFSIPESEKRAAASKNGAPTEVTVAK